MYEDRNIGHGWFHPHRTMLLVAALLLLVSYFLPGGEFRFRLTSETKNTYETLGNLVSDACVVLVFGGLGGNASEKNAVLCTAASLVFCLGCFFFAALFFMTTNVRNRWTVVGFVPLLASWIPVFILNQRIVVFRLGYFMFSTAMSVIFIAVAIMPVSERTVKGRGFPVISPSETSEPKKTLDEQC